MTHKRKHPALQTYTNTWAHKRGYALELYSLMEVQQFSTTTFKAPDDGHISRNMQYTSDVKNNFKIKKSQILRF
jgi:hypothetical protein